jgi:hypothetical protein
MIKKRRGMKIHRGYGRYLLIVALSAILVPSYSVAVPNDASIQAQLEHRMQQFKKALKCAVNKTGCTDEQAMQLRLAAGAVIGLLALLTLSGVKYWSKRETTSVENLDNRFQNLIFNPPFERRDHWQKKFNAAVSNEWAYVELLGALEAGLPLTFQKINQIKDIHQKLLNKNTKASCAAARKFYDALFILDHNAYARKAPRLQYEDTTIDGKSYSGRQAAESFQKLLEEMGKKQQEAEEKATKFYK